MIIATYEEHFCVHPFDKREILFAFHDIDGTHSLIREWPPVMSIVLHDVIHHGLSENFDNKENQNRLILEAGKNALPETDRFCTESAGLSALTQMEWAIRRAIEEGTVPFKCDLAQNHQKILLIEQGIEVFPLLPDSPGLTALLQEYTPRLFRLYENVLNGYCRDRNLKKAKYTPELFRVKGSIEFMHFLKDAGVKNYFVTGAVVQQGMGMYEEVETLGYTIGPGELVEDIIGSSWDKKIPKDEIMANLLNKLHIEGKKVLVVGDGRSEIAAGIHMGALTVSRLPKNAARQRELHMALKTNLIIEDYLEKAIAKVFKSIP